VSGGLNRVFTCPGSGALVITANAQSSQKFADEVVGLSISNAFMFPGKFFTLLEEGIKFGSSNFFF
jgi:hypothetical protein